MGVYVYITFKKCEMLWESLKINADADLLNVSVDQIPERSRSGPDCPQQCSVLLLS